MKITCYVHQLASIVLQGNTHIVMEGDIYTDSANLKIIKHLHVSRWVLNSAQCTLELNAHLALLAQRPSTLHREVRAGMDPLYLVEINNNGAIVYDLYQPAHTSSESQE